MSKIHAQTNKTARLRGEMTTRALAACALLAALSIILARLIMPMPNETTRFSLEAVPIFIAGMLFGPVAGGLVGFTADLVGCLFSGYGYNPLFCVPPILYGVVAGLFRPMFVKGISFPKILLAFLPSIVFGSILCQSAALAYVYGGGGFLPFFLTKLVERSIQFAITMVADAAIVWMLNRANVFTAAHLWPPVLKSRKEDDPK